ncbi:MAG: hypothetical protein MAG431_02532 [Chloroflexi bacterium]|nr:hypothetical protein [Chloroflexota bacterium]
MAKLEKEILKKISQKVYQRFPDFQGKKPKVKRRPKAENAKEFPPGHLLIYRKEVAGPDGQTITRLVRVVINEEGKIKKISTSK